MIRIENDGQKIISFDPPPAFARGGVYLLSFNAAACRVILPRELEPWIAEMQTAEVVHITRQPIARLSLADGLQLMFDDGTDTPFMLHTDPRAMIGVLPSSADSGRTDLVCTVWTMRRGQPHRSLSRPATFEDLRSKGAD